MEPLGVRRSVRGAASWWMLIALVLVAAAGFYIWYQQHQVEEPGPQQLQVATADSSGELPAQDTSRRANPGSSSLFPIYPDTPLTGPYIAPPPGFASSRSGPVANLLDYARQMRFDPARGMEFTLPVDEYGRRDRTVRIEPLLNLRRLDSTAFAQGRVIARVRSTAAIPSMNLHNGENYLWVQGTLGQPVKAEMWSTSVVVPPKEFMLVYTSQPPANAPANHDAFWVGNDMINQTLWIVCGRGWCHT